MNHEILNRRAEAMLSPEQAEASEIRAKNKVQYRNPFDSFLDNIDNDAERRAATEKEEKRMDDNFIKLGKIFKDADFKWHLDGALNISLLKGKYIGIHKDVDISVEKSELEKIDDYLGRMGYGLFLSHEENLDNKKVMERVGPDQFGKAQNDGLIIASIDKDGKISEENSLNFIDAHVIERDGNGDPTGVNKVVLPKKWLEPKTINFKGEKLNVAQPIKVAYYKLHGTRAYDRTDLKKLAETGEISLSDVDDIGRVFKEEFVSTKPEIESILKILDGKIKDNATANEIFEIFMNEPTIKGRIKEPDIPMIRELSIKVSESPDKSSKKITELIYETAKINKRNNLVLDKIKELRQWVEDAENIKKIKLYE